MKLVVKKANEIFKFIIDFESINNDSEDWKFRESKWVSVESLLNKINYMKELRENKEKDNEIYNKSQDELNDDFIDELLAFIKELEELKNDTI